MSVSVSHRSRRAAAVLAVTAGVVLGLTGTASAVPGVGAAAPLAAATDPWSQEPVVGELFDMTSQGWSGSLPVGTSTTTTMTITAKQDLVLRPGNWYSDRTYFDFALSGTCPGSLWGSARMAPGDTCTVTWTVHPDDLSSVSAGWSFYATPVDAGGVATGERVLGQHNLSFSSYVFVAENVDFGPVTVGGSATEPVTYRNASAVDAMLAVDAPWSPVTMPDRPADPVLVPAGESVTLDAVYTPTWAGDLSSSSWFRTTLPGSTSRATDIVRFTGSGVDEIVEPPVDPTDPTDPATPPVDPTDPATPSVDPTDPATPPVDPTDPPVDPTEPPTPTVPTVPTEPTQPTEAPEQTVAPLTAAPSDGRSTAATPAPAESAPPEASAGQGGVLASTGAQWSALALGALTLVCLGAVLRTWSRARAARDSS